MLVNHTFIGIFFIDGESVNMIKQYFFVLLNKKEVSKETS